MQRDTNESIFAHSLPLRYLGDMPAPVKSVELLLKGAGLHFIWLEKCKLCAQYV